MFKQIICCFIGVALSATPLFSQQESFQLENVLGHRSVSYQHLYTSELGNRWLYKQLILFDYDHTSENETLYFIRNRIAYRLSTCIQLHAAAGIKNPGIFGTVGSQFNIQHNALSINYSIGSTYQEGFTLEQSIVIHYLPKLGPSLNGYLKLLLIANTDLKSIQRGIQQFRLGIKQNQWKVGYALNLDQFDNASKQLINQGIFITYNL